MVKSRIRKDKALISRMYFTWFLLGVLYAFFVLVLNAFGVRLGFIAFFVIVLGGVQYFLSDKMVIWSSGAKLIERKQDPELFLIVEKLAEEAGIKTPKIAIMKSEVPNAFATGRNSNNALVAVTLGLRAKLNQDELRAVMAHEIAHILNGDMKVLAIANFFVTFSSFLMQIFFWNMLFGGMSRNRNGGAGAVFVLYLLTMVVYFLGQLLVLALTRYREFGADHTGALLSESPGDLASALQKISSSSIKVPTQDLRQFKTANAFMIIPALSGNDIGKLMSTHPPVAERIRKLREIQKQLG